MSPHFIHFIFANWWFQPTWKIFVKLDRFPNRDENKTYLKPPPSLFISYLAIVQKDRLD